MNQSILKQRIDKMFEAEQEMMKAMREHSAPYDHQLIQANTKEIKEIIKEVGGFPSYSLVGHELSHKAWFLIQHSDHDIEFQQECLQLMSKLPDTEVSSVQRAMLEDRVRVNTGQKQLYGTQFYTDEIGQFGPRPIEDQGDLDKRRAEVGLEPFEEYKKQMEELHFSK